MTKRYHYTECGLDNVILVGLEPVQDDAGETVIRIPNIAGLHRAIAEAILKRASGISGKELRFLRTEMGLTQAELAQRLHHDVQSVGRWERGEVAIPGDTEALVRLLAAERLRIPLDATAEEVSARCVTSAASEPIQIDAHDTHNYRPLAA